MYYIDEDEVLGYETEDGFLCNTCFHEMHGAMDDSVGVITPATADEYDEVIICDNCADIIWGIDTAQPY